MTLPLQDVLELPTNEVEERLGFTGVSHFIEQSHISLFLTIDHDYYSDELALLRKSALDNIIASDTISLETKKSLSISDDKAGLHVIIDLDENNNLPFENMEQLAAFGQDFRQRMYGPNPETKFTNFTGNQDPHDEFNYSDYTYVSEGERRIAGATILTDVFLNRSSDNEGLNLLDFYRDNLMILDENYFRVEDYMKMRENGLSDDDIQAEWVKGHNQRSEVHDRDGIYALFASIGDNEGESVSELEL